MRISQPRKIARRAVGAAMVLVATMTAARSAEAHGGLRVGIGFGFPGFVAAPVYLPPPVVYAPPPVYYAPAYVGYGPPPRVLRHHYRRVRHYRRCCCCSYYR
jgi:hypothetical protein